MVTVGNMERSNECEVCNSQIGRTGTKKREEIVKKNLAIYLDKKEKDKIRSNGSTEQI